MIKSSNKNEVRIFNPVNFEPQFFAQYQYRSFIQSLTLL